MKKLILCLAFILIIPNISQADPLWERQSNLPDGLASYIDFYCVWGASSNQIFVAGQVGTILYYDGTNWQKMESNTDVNLYGIWGTAYDNVYAVGEDGIFLHYNGMTWSHIATEIEIDLRGIYGTSENDIFIVGNSGLILKFDGDSFVQMVSPTGGTLYSVWGMHAEDIYAAGGGLIPCFDDFCVSWYKGETLHFDGTAWKIETSYSSGHTFRLSGVWGSASDDVYVVSTKPNIYHYNGQAWQTVEDAPLVNSIYSIWGRNNRDIYAVSTNFEIYHYDGAQWQRFSIEKTYDQPINILYGVWTKYGCPTIVVGTDNRIYMSHDGSNVSKGDVNGDMVIDLKDVILSNRVATGIQSSEHLSLSSDVNSDNRIGLEEAIYVLHLLTGNM